LAPVNIPDEQTPWAIIIINAPSTPHTDRDITPLITRAIWTTEEYAITTFMSLWIRQIKPNTPPPNTDSPKKILGITLEVSKGLIRIIPYPPSFNNTPAKTIDPMTGASTCALGNHKCTEYIGNLTKKAIHKINKIIVLLILLTDIALRSLSFTDMPQPTKLKIKNSKGREANNV